MKITSASISPQPKDMFDPMPVVTATFEDGSTQRLFDYFPDEISFTEDEFVGLTLDEAFALKHKKDVAYLKS